MYIPSLYTWFNAILVTGGIYLLTHLFWTVVYQWKYGLDYGERYFHYEISKEEKKQLKKSYSLLRRLKGR